MSRAEAVALPPADRLRLTVLFGVSRLSLAAAGVLLSASNRLIGPARHLVTEGRA